MVVVIILVLVIVIMLVQSRIVVSGIAVWVVISISIL